MNLFQSYVIESDGTKRPMTKEEKMELQLKIAVVPLVLPIALFIWIVKLIHKPELNK